MLYQCNLCRDRRYFDSPEFGKIPCPWCRPDEYNAPEAFVRTAEGPDEWETSRNPPLKTMCKECCRSTGCMHSRDSRIVLRD